MMDKKALDTLRPELEGRRRGPVGRRIARAVGNRLGGLLEAGFGLAGMEPDQAERAAAKIVHGDSVIHQPSDEWVRNFDIFLARVETATNLLLAVIVNRQAKIGDDDRWRPYLDHAMRPATSAYLQEAEHLRAHICRAISRRPAWTHVWNAIVGSYASLKTLRTHLNSQKDAGVEIDILLDFCKEARSFVEHCKSVTALTHPELEDQGSDAAPEDA